MANLFSQSADLRMRARQWWSGRTQQQKLLMLGGGALAVALAFGGWELSQQTDYAVVYSGLSPRMGGNIIAALQKDNVPFRLLNNGDLIEVPKADAARVRLQLAEQGLPARATSTLWNQLQNEKLGTSSFVEHTTYLRALESGLARDIQSVHGVESASVNLAIPRHTPFLERMPVPKAAVTLHVMPGVTLSHEQVFGITHLVASSVPGLHASQVTVVDQSGQALTAKATGSQSSTVLRLQHSVERSYKKQVVALLSPLVGGTKNLRVIVDANIDLSHHQESSITYGMGHVVTAAVQSSADRGNMAATAFGIPGALSNQPPGAPSAPITAGATSTAPKMTLAEIKAMMPRSSKDQQHFHYVLDKTVGFRKGAPWRLRTLSISVLVNGKEVAVNPPASAVAPAVSVGNGKPAVHKAATSKAVLAKPVSTGAEFTPQIMATLKGMVANAIHASAPNGTIDIAAIPFQTLAPPPPLPWWQKISPWAVWHQVEWFLLGLIALLMFRRAIKGLLPNRAEVPTAQPMKPEETTGSAGAATTGAEASSGLPMASSAEGGTLLNLDGVSEGRLEDNMNIIKNLIRSDTARAVEVVREWIGNLGEGEING